MSAPRVPGPSSLVAGQTIAGRYLVKAHLGSGGMGDVFEVEHTLLGKRFALKRLSGDMTSDRDMVERFLREARAAAATGHPGIVDVVDLGFADDGLPYLVMERLSGETLRRRLDRGPLDQRTLVRLGRGVLGALGAVHRAEIIHRDIKPENLFLCADGRIKILDFGLSHRATVDVRLTQSGAVMGTPLYMSPEQARGEECDARTDLYALGAVLYECGSGRPPFAAAAYSVLVAMILEIKPNPDRLAHLDEEVREVILAALAKKRDDRPGTAEAMRAALGGGADDDADDAALWSSSTTMAPPVEGMASAPTMASPRPGAVRAAIVDEASAPTMMPISGAPTVAAPAPAPALAPAPTPAPAPAQDAATVVQRRSRWPWVAAAVAAIVAIAIVAVVATRPGTGTGTGTGAGAREVTEWEQEVLRGDLEAAEEASHRAQRRAPGDLELAGRDLLLALLENRTRAYQRVRDLDGVRLPAYPASVVAAVRAVERGQPEVGADSLSAAGALVEPGSVDELLIRHARAELLLLADRFDLARPEYERVLEQRPGFAPALDGLLQRLLFLDELDHARRRVDAFIAAAPEGAPVAMLEIELLIGERRYRDALARVEKMLTANPGDDGEAYQYRGDLRILLGDPTGAISAYAAVDDELKRDNYVAGALAHQGRYAESRALLVNAMARYPAGTKGSRLSKLMVDAALLALETDDRALAEAAVAATGDAELRDLEAVLQSAAAFAQGARQRLTGVEVDPSGFPLRARSPLYVLLAVRDRVDPEALEMIRAATAPEEMHFGLVPSHVYPALWLERGRLEHRAGDPEAALLWLDRVIRPRHYDAARGMIILRALDEKAQLLDGFGRSGEAAAVRREIEALRAR